MTYKGHIHNHTVVFDDPVQLPEGTEVTVELRPPPKTNGNANDPWAAVEKDLNALRHSTQSLLAQELLPPTSAAFQRAIHLISVLRTQNADPPFRTLPNGDGGITLEWIDTSHREMVQSIEISADGIAEITEFSNNRLQSRRQMN